MAIESKYSSFRLNKPYMNSYLFLDWLGSIVGAGIQSNTESANNERNLKYQRERNAIEDARYEDETAYNRAFAEDERDYNRAFAEDERAYQRAFAEDEREYQRALQQQIFEREDTALERQASSLSAMGINPASVQMNGLGAGQALSPSFAGAGGSAPSISAPSASSHSGQTLHSDVIDYITPILSLANSINNVQTGGFQRDLLSAEKDKKLLENQAQAIENERLENKLETEQEQREEDLRHSKANNPNVEKSTKASAERNERENQFQSMWGVTDNSHPYARLSADTSNFAYRAVTDTSKAVSQVGTKALDVLSDKAKNGLKKYNEATKKAQDWIVNKAKKAGSWFKKNTVSADDLPNMFGF